MQTNLQMVVPLYVVLCRTTAFDLQQCTSHRPWGKHLNNIPHTDVDRGTTNLSCGQPDFLERIGTQPVVQVIGTIAGIFAIGGRGRIGGGVLSLVIILLLKFVSLLALRNGSSLVTAAMMGRNRTRIGGRRRSRSSPRHFLLLLSSFGRTDVRTVHTGVRVAMALWGAGVLFVVGASCVLVREGRPSRSHMVTPVLLRGRMV